MSSASSPGRQPDERGNAGRAGEPGLAGADADQRAAERRARLKRDIGRYSGLGFQFAATVGVFAFGGYWLDQRLGTLPLFLITGVLLGFAGGILSLIRRVPPGGGASSRRRKNDAST